MHNSNPDAEDTSFGAGGGDNGSSAPNDASNNSSVVEEVSPVNQHCEPKSEPNGNASSQGTEVKSVESEPIPPTSPSSCGGILGERQRQSLHSTPPKNETAASDTTMTTASGIGVMITGSSTATSTASEIDHGVTSFITLMDNTGDAVESVSPRNQYQGENSNLKDVAAQSGIAQALADDAAARAQAKEASTTMAAPTSSAFDDESRNAGVFIESLAASPITSLTFDAESQGGMTSTATMATMSALEAPLVSIPEDDGQHEERSKRDANIDCKDTAMPPMAPSYAASTTDNLGTSVSSTLATDRGSGQPGAFHVLPRSAFENDDPSPGTVCYLPGTQTGVTSPASHGTVEESPLEAASRHLEHSDEVHTEAYLVEQEPEPPAATVVHTYFGIERKRLLWLSSIGLGILAIVLSCVLGILIPKTRDNDVGQNDVCGPLCGWDTDVPNPEKTVYGKKCKDWDMASSNQVVNGTECSDKYLSVAYGCVCPNIEMPSTSCGMLCSDGAELSHLDLMAKDINTQELTCQDWELKSQFDTDPNECVNYNAIGALCGCVDNEPHPDACGSLCPGGIDAGLHSGKHTVWGTSCDDWNTMSTFLPIWYNNKGGESCDEHYSDVVFGCACPGVQDPELTCGTLCQQRSTCEPICQDGSTIPDPKRIVSRATCAEWEVHARLEVHGEVCPFYPMTGAQCGCDNIPPRDSCGPLCGLENNTLSDPDRIVHGQTCSEWHYKSLYLFPEFGKRDDGEGGIIESCDAHFSRVAYGCGCSDVDPPADGCGVLCKDGSPVPDLAMVVNARTCGDLELLSLFETDSKQCSLYEVFGSLCGCPDANKYSEECFEYEHLYNETYHISAGGSLYRFSFGEGAYFAQIQSNNDLFLIGNYHGIGTGSEENVAVYGGGAPCGLWGPRTGTVAIVEDETVTEPTVSYVIEPSICVYRAELRVPKFCT